jgi:hypothetical protein
MAVPDARWAAAARRPAAAAEFRRLQPATQRQALGHEGLAVV